MRTTFVKLSINPSTIRTGPDSDNPPLFCWGAGVLGGTGPLSSFESQCLHYAILLAGSLILSENMHHMMGGFGDPPKVSLLTTTKLSCCKWGLSARWRLRRVQSDNIRHCCTSCSCLSEFASLEMSDKQPQCTSVEPSGSTIKN